MGTRFRTMLAPINASTGDGRRFAAGSITLAAVPFPFEWAREREGGHDGAVVVGAVQEATVLSIEAAVKAEWISPDAAKSLTAAGISEAVWGRGEFLDDADRDTMPRLAEDVAEAMTLIGAGTLGPSVDLDSFEAVPVIEGTDTPVSWEDIEDYYDEHGEEPALELLVTEGRVRAATLVSIPAFAETSRPLELIDAEPAEASTDPETLAVDNLESTARVLLASVSTLAPAGPAVAAFDKPALSGPTPITFDFETGQVFGHVATWRTCHVGYSDVCVTPPRDAAAGGYAWFNRFPVETTDGDIVWAGRLTVGGLHAGLSLTAGAAMAAYDTKTVAAHVRAYEDEYGIVVAGVIEPGLDEATKRVLSRRKVSGDWRETPAGLSLVELLALSPGPRQHSEPGFPVNTFSRAGRQTALTASFGPWTKTGVFQVAQIDVAGAVQAALAADRAGQRARAELAAELQELQRDATADSRALLAGMLEG